MSVRKRHCSVTSSVDSNDPDVGEAPRWDPSAGRYFRSGPITGGASRWSRSGRRVRTRAFRLGARRALTENQLARVARNPSCRSVRTAAGRGGRVVAAAIAAVATGARAVRGSHRHRNTSHATDASRAGQRVCPRSTRTAPRGPRGARGTRSPAVAGEPLRGVAGLGFDRSPSAGYSSTEPFSKPLGFLFR